ncbi:MAG: tRNA (adenosine(37)-N6)-dimethylallyltransferase MiaA [bacterium]
MSRKLIVILGPTASGKTDLAIKLAKQFNGEIVSADSRQVYKGMDIGTAKPTKKQLARVPHYLVDIVTPKEDFNAALYKKLAVKAIKDIQKKGKLPFLVGGTGLYIRAVVDNLSFLAVPANKKLRDNLEQESTAKLYMIYKVLDPAGAELIDKENRRRLIRAVEVCLITAKPFWEQRKQNRPIFDVLQIGISLSAEKLTANNDSRVKKMIKNGLEKEVESLVKAYGGKISALQTIGYQEWKNKEEAAEKIKLHTLQFARRQNTWFKKDKRIVWLPSPDHRLAAKLIKDFLKKENP